MQTVKGSFTDLPRGRAQVALEHLDFLTRILRRQLPELSLETQLSAVDFAEVWESGDLTGVTIKLPLSAALEALHDALVTRAEEESQS